MKKRIVLPSILILSILLSMTIWRVGSVFSAWVKDFDTSTPAGSESPTLIDNYMRDDKAAMQERLNDGIDGANEGDMYFPLTGTEVSDTEAGEHRKVTLRERDNDPGGAEPANNANKGFLYTKEADSKTEFFLRSEAEDAGQITQNGGKLLPMPHQATGTDYILLNAALATWTDLADMSLTFTTIGGDVLVSFNVAIYANASSAAASTIDLRILLDDVEQIRTRLTIKPMPANATTIPTSLQYLCESLSAAEHTWKVQYSRVEEGWSQKGDDYNRILNAIEYRP